MKRRIKEGRTMLKVVVKKYFKLWSYYIIALGIGYLLWNMFDMFPKEYVPIMNLFALGTGFFISIFHLKSHNNIFICMILALYVLATIMEVQSDLHNYTNQSYKLWAVGNWLIPIASIFELGRFAIKIAKTIGDEIE